MRPASSIHAVGRRALLIVISLLTLYPSVASAWPWEAGANLPATETGGTWTLLRVHRSCVVPPLRGDSLATARRDLSAAHCRLGSVHRPAGHHGAQRVTKQSVRAGKRLANGARVSLWLGFTQQETAGSTGQTIYVANSGGNSITEYPAKAGGNVSPTTTISGANTGLSSPDGLAVDSSGTIYVANSGGNSITEYPAKAGGNVSPTTTISGANTGLSSPDGLAVDSSGTIYVANFGGARITEEAAGGGGNDISG